MLTNGDLTVYNLQCITTHKNKQTKTVISESILWVLMSLDNCDTLVLLSRFCIVVCMWSMEEPPCNAFKWQGWQAAHLGSSCFGLATDSHALIFPRVFEMMQANQWKLLWLSNSHLHRDPFPASAWPKVSLALWVSSFATERSQESCRQVILDQRKGVEVNIHSKQSRQDKKRLELNQTWQVPYIYNILKF
jgi:hypothetical protein